MYYWVTKVICFQCLDTANHFNSLWRFLLSDMKRKRHLSLHAVKLYFTCKLLMRAQVGNRRGSQLEYWWVENMRFCMHDLMNLMKYFETWYETYVKISFLNKSGEIMFERINISTYCSFQVQTSCIKRKNIDLKYFCPLWVKDIFCPAVA